MEINKETNAIVVLSIAALLMALIPVGVSWEFESDWPQFHRDPQHSGSSRLSAPNSAKIAWVSEDINPQKGSSVSVAEGRVFVNCVNRLVCLDQLTGQILWNAAFEPTPDTCQEWGCSPVFDNGRVFLSGLKTVCLNATDGREIWSFSPPTGRGAVDGGPVVAYGRVLVSDWDGHQYYCLDEETGGMLWNCTVKGIAQSTPAISEGKAILTAWEWSLGGVVYCINFEDGSEIWNHSLSNSPCGSAALSQNAAYITTYNFEGDGSVMAISIRNGSLLWEEYMARTDCTPALHGERLYVCGGIDGFSAKATYCFNSSTGDLIWSTSDDEGIGEWRCSPAYADGMLFVGKTENMNYAELYALNASTGKTVWSYPAGGSSPAVAGGMVFTIGQGRVYAFGSIDDADNIK